MTVKVPLFGGENGCLDFFRGGAFAVGEARRRWMYAGAVAERAGHGLYEFSLEREVEDPFTEMLPQTGDALTWVGKPLAFDLVGGNGEAAERLVPVDVEEYRAVLKDCALAPRLGVSRDFSSADM